MRGLLRVWSGGGGGGRGDWNLAAVDEDARSARTAGAPPGDCAVLCGTARRAAGGGGGGGGGPR